MYKPLNMPAAKEVDEASVMCKARARPHETTRNRTTASVIILRELRVDYTARPSVRIKAPLHSASNLKSRLSHSGLSRNLRTGHREIP